MGQKQSVDDYARSDAGSEVFSVSGASQWSNNSNGSDQAAIPIGVAPAISTAEFSFIPYLSRRDCTRILGSAPVGAYVLFSDPSGGANLAVRMSDRLQRLKLRKDAAGITLQVPTGQPQPAFGRLIDLLLYYAVDREGVGLRLALPCFDFSTLREEDDATTRRRSLARNMSTIEEDETTAFGFDSASSAESGSSLQPRIIPDLRELSPSAAIMATVADVQRRLHSTVVKAVKPESSGERSATMPADASTKPDFYDVHSWWRAADPGKKGGSVDPWCHGPYWSHDLAVGVLRSYGGNDGSFLIRQRVASEALASACSSPTHDILALIDGKVLQLPLRWTGTEYQLEMTETPPQLSKLDPSTTFRDLHHAYVVLALYAQENFLPLAKAVAVPVDFQGAGRSQPRWFFPALTQQQAIAVLATCPVGTFLVRKDSSSSSGVHYLSLTTQSDILHFCIKEHEDLSWSINGVIVEGAVSLPSMMDVLSAATDFFRYPLQRYIPCLPPFEAVSPPAVTPDDLRPSPTTTASTSTMSSIPSPSETPSPKQSSSLTEPPSPTSSENASRRSSLVSTPVPRSRSRLDEATLLDGSNHVKLVLKRRRQESWGVMLRTVHGQPGSVVGGVDSGSPADCSGLKFGDVLISAGSKSLLACTHEQIRNLLRTKNNVHVTVARFQGSQAGTLKSRSSSSVFR
eukprot:m.124303 g.124303  ORF g.124303 m.124303 type:complete len:686 (+) comp15703_c0_seq2:254-2311(+)